MKIANAKYLGISKEDSPLVGLPMYESRPAAGLPFLGDDSTEESLDLNDVLVQNPNSTFFVRVDGDSMEGVGIFSEDILVVDRSIVPVSGKIVIAAVYGEMVVKILEKTANVTRLLSANENYQPINITNDDECFLWGVVVGSVRSFK